MVNQYNNLQTAFHSRSNHMTEILPNSNQMAKANSIEQFAYFCYNVPFSDISNVVYPNANKNYIIEKWDIFKKDKLSWFLSLDESRKITIIKMMEEL